MVWLQELFGLTRGAARLNWDAQDVSRLVVEVVSQNAVYNERLACPIEVVQPEC